MKILLYNGSKINVINLVYAQRLGLKILKANIEAQKIYGSALEIFGMVIANFQVDDKIDRPRLFQETFLLTNTKFKMILRIPFLKINNVNVLFGQKILI